MTVPPGPYPSQPASTSNQSVFALVLSILGLVCPCGLFSIIGWILASQQLRAIRQGRAPVDSEGIAKAAQILGILGTLLMLAALIWIVFMGGLAVLSVFFSEMAR